MNISVSEGLSDLSTQVSDAQRFLEMNRADILRLAGRPDVADLTLDFSIPLRIDGERVAAQFELLPASLVRLAGESGIALELSIYPVGEE
jgi:hypothetical protein